MPKTHQSNDTESCEPETEIVADAGPRRLPDFRGPVYDLAEKIQRGREDEFMPDRFFCDQTIDGDEAALVGPEAHHLVHVLRAVPGDEVILFDGSGVEFLARLDRIQRREAKLSILERRAIDRELTSPLIVGVSLPKGDRQRWLVEKLTELGVTEMVPLQSTRSVAEGAHSTLVRLGRSVVEASKQCGRNRLMRISPSVALERYLARPPVDAVRMLAHPSGSTGMSPPPRDCAKFLAIGPEGGFTGGEVDKARGMGWQCLSLGRTMLRVETAALVLAARSIAWQEPGTAVGTG